MNIIIRKESENDHKIVFDLIKKAFENEVYSDHKEQFLVERLRKSVSFIAELALVAEVENKIVGYILLTKIVIGNNRKQTESLALAPVAVLPEFQGKGVGSNLITFAHKKAKELNYQSIILLGHPDYYPKFGYEKACNFGISLPFDVPEENCMAIELQENSLKDSAGMVVYPSAFYEE
ncbi:GNAT family N-acetyltransferase [Empedobacter brevis]|uniref:GNAT family N-acetyltransferase n=1 Tax=Empedobacter brevis TaxID=247 RepID=UPI0028AB4C6A|nr:N-acetyltransferase [Empedobacter brevis]